MLEPSHKLLTRGASPAILYMVEPYLSEAVHLVGDKIAVRLIDRVVTPTYIKIPSKPPPLTATDVGLPSSVWWLP